MKKTLSIVLAAVMLLSVTAGLNLTALAGTYGDFNYSIQYDGTIEVTGYVGVEDEIVIPDEIANRTVTSIGASAFQGKSITAVVIPDTIVEVKNNAFHTTALTEITIPGSVMTIGDSAFWSCKSLKRAVLEDGVETIGKSAFAESNALSSVSMPESLRTIDDAAFDRCFPLDVKIPNGVETIGQSAFNYCNIFTELVIPDSVTSIGNSAFGNCSKLISVTIPNSVTAFGEDIFRSCSNLVSAVFEDGVTVIPKGMFSGCEKLSSVTIPDSVTSIGNSAFNGCRQLTHIDLSENLTVIGEHAFGYSGLTSVKLPDKMTSLSNYAFSECDSLMEIGFPDGLKEIGNHVFRKCTALEEIILPDSIEKIGWCAFQGANSLKAVNPSNPDDLTSTSILPEGLKRIEDGAFNGCSLTGLVIPDSVEYMGSNAFSQNSRLKDVTIGKGLTSLDGQVFCGTGLTEITIPDNIKTIGSGAFKSCGSLKNVMISDSVEVIGDEAFSACKSLESIFIPDSVTKLGVDIFNSCTSLTDIRLSRSLTDIPREAFSSCKSLKSIELPEGITRIGVSAYQNCTALERVILPNTLREISCDIEAAGWSGGSFSGCTSLKNIDLPYGLDSIWYGSFSGCTSLESIVMPETVRNTCGSSFSRCTSLKRAVVYGLGASGGYRYQAIGSEFYGCTALEEVIIADNPPYLSQSTFDHCTSLKTVTVPESVRWIGNWVFAGCNSLESVTILNRNCEIYGDSSVDTADMIYGYKNSTAHRYAKEKNKYFVPLDTRITIDGEMGSVTFNGQPISYETVSVDYGISYTLNAIAGENQEFVGWMADGKMITTSPSFTTVAYADVTYTPVFNDKTAESFDVIFMDYYGNVATIINSSALADLEAMPEAPEYIGLTFDGWSKTLEQVKALNQPETVYAQYSSDLAMNYTVTAKGCNITVDGVTAQDTASAHYNSKVTVSPVNPQEDVNYGWRINNNAQPAAYGESYTFFCGSDITLKFVAGRKAVPSVTCISKTADGAKVKFLATRCVPSDCRLIESGFIYGKGMAADDLVLENVGLSQGTAGGTVKQLKNKDNSPDGQFALTYGVAAMNATAAARAYVIYSDADNNISVAYSNVLIHTYDTV